MEPCKRQTQKIENIDWVPLGIVLFVFLAFFLGYFGLIAKGFSPADDALRHVAKAISGKSWDQVLVFRADFNGKLDTHPGWHFLLEVFKRLGFEKDALICISIAIPWLILFGISMVFLKRPECMVVILSIFFMMDPGLGIRLFLGRPFLVAMGITMAYLFLWGRQDNKKPSGSLLILTTVLCALHVWIHPSWYLLGLPFFSVLVSGALKKDIITPFYFGACLFCGTVAGAIATLHPADVLFQNIQILGLAIFSDVPPMVTEFEPASISAATASILLIALFSRLLVHPWPGIDWRHPAIILAFLGLGMGFFIGRFWNDWGFAGVLVWFCLDLQCLMKNKIGQKHISRIFTTGVASVLLAVAVPNSARLFPQFFIDRDIALIQKIYKEDKTWFPGNGGIVYSNSMHTFYRLFYTLPEGNWRYILGYEQGLMPQEDKTILYSDPEEGYEGWVKKMKPEDRLVIYAAGINKERVERHRVLSVLEWKFLMRDHLLGRMKQ